MPVGMLGPLSVFYALVHPPWAQADEFTLYPFVQTSDFMDPQTLAGERSRLIREYGEWTDHNIRLAEGLYTIGNGVESRKLPRIVQIVADLSPKPLSELRVLDLACLEGQYAIEFAMHGATAVAIEGREANLAKARFAKQALGLEKLTLYHDDVRNLSKERYREFDVVLCLGILYHLDAPDVFRFVEQIASVCTHLTIFNTYISVNYEKAYSYGGRTLWGRDYVEHDPASQQEERLSAKWASLDNVKSVWMTQTTLMNMLVSLGFTSVYNCQAPIEPGNYVDWVSIVGVKGTRQTIKSNPSMNERPPLQFEEPVHAALSPRQQKYSEVKRRFTFLVPRRMRRILKSVLGPLSTHFRGRGGA